MPFTYVVDRAAGIVRATGHGVIRFDDLAAHLEALVAGGVGHLPQLIDARDAEHDLSVSDMRRLVALVGRLRAAHGLRHRTALAVSTPVAFGMARMYGALAETVDPDFAVFHDLDEADAWLRATG